MYLQDPLHCDRNIPYRNPHLLSGLDDPPVTTFALMSSCVPIESKALTRPDLHALLKNEDPLQETDAPNIVATPLYR